ncbi:hypothetical protein K7472_30315 [Streptomyces sp. PTM05]|uniref:Uncharacterized protein n=1 Tax=Streptantibioticus parmotrematis TaxID=2873249 RepID=A0ABS7R0W6_9ACTN|nr:hypothetical protein [Streptantibioticus parmotrematis]MBY8889108.1 hypothetical protein [Streptantibioticus parmotrematis]
MTGAFVTGVLGAANGWGLSAAHVPLPTAAVYGSAVCSVLLTGWHSVVRYSRTHRYRCPDPACPVKVEVGEHLTEAEDRRWTLFADDHPRHAYRPSTRDA